MKKQTKIFIAVILLVIGAYFGYDYMYQDHRDIKTEEAFVKVSATELKQLFDSNESPEVLDHTVEVSGSVTEVNSLSITLDNSVQCNFETEQQEIKLNDSVTIKGRCIGYDSDLFEVAILDQSIIIK